MNDFYLDTAKTLVRAAPHIFFDDTFALKGGTAINPDPRGALPNPARHQEMNARGSKGADVSV